MSSGLSQRLKAISSLVQKNYTSVWDICCDHGKLGLEILKRDKCEKLFLVDCVESIMANLKYLQSEQVDVICKDGAFIDNLGSNSLVCICGVGGEEMIHILEGLELRNDLRDTDFILSPHNQAYKVRSYLRSRGLNKLSEHLITDRSWTYEVLFVGHQYNEEVSEIGEELYLNSCDTSLKHLKKITKHYHNTKETIASKYSALLTKLT
ncbi:tRNA (adenine(22)-N(1))-methyltransferase TrmK [Bacteriovorax sp. Seq25_V]|uniref:tRNA (adenine(22)-N(1))-methyltransferase TrmK n=1 Tax=Bacteriovorax sp. Seq25_V TaxID=1201288 RepID=UPI00038A1257|nr:tRNA (adenine(22)-N(1))-methyltransferase TrmK [Bacteriovorax sp. Seq25_V]EQC47634.1 PF04816 family protein [Bacteriovorax sp. Seq25_V]